MFHFVFVIIWANEKKATRQVQWGKKKKKTPKWKTQKQQNREIKWLMNFFRFRFGNYNWACKRNIWRKKKKSLRNWVKKWKRNFACYIRVFRKREKLISSKRKVFQSFPFFICFFFSLDCIFRFIILLMIKLWTNKSRVQLEIFGEKYI